MRGEGRHNPIFYQLPRRSTEPSRRFDGSARRAGHDPTWRTMLSSRQRCRNSLQHRGRGAAGDPSAVHRIRTLQTTAFQQSTSSLISLGPAGHVVARSRHFLSPQPGPPGPAAQPAPPWPPPPLSHARRRALDNDAKDSVVSIAGRPAPLQSRQSLRHA